MQRWHSDITSPFLLTKITEPLRFKKDLWRSCSPMSLLKQGRSICINMWVHVQPWYTLPKGLLEMLSLYQCTGLGACRQPPHTAHKSRNKVLLKQGLDLSNSLAHYLIPNKKNSDWNYAAEGQHRPSLSPCPQSPTQTLPLSEQHLVMHNCQPKSSYSLDFSFTEDRTLGTFSRTNEWAFITRRTWEINRTSV